MYSELSESERFPMLSPRGRALLHAMRQDPLAPRWNWPNGEQLDATGLERVEKFAKELNASHACSTDWLQGFADFCVAEVPFHRRHCGGTLTAIDLLPPTLRPESGTSPDSNRSTI